ncbi:MAG TPA: hypothetical protein VGN16_03010 [Acidobacteriaceae bacterium]|jgi:hypothetical protein
MANPVIATFPEKPVFLSGQELPVRTIVDNRGGAPVQVPSRDAPSFFVYTMQSQKEGGPVYGLSRLITDRRRSPDRGPDAPFQGETLPAGAKFEWADDIAAYWNEGFAPGKYSLTVREDTLNIESPRTLVTILPLAVESFSSEVSVDHLASLAAHRRDDGQVVLLQRESAVLDPREGVFRTRQVLLKGGPVTVATAIDIVPAGSGRWFAWTQAGKLNASVGWGNRTIVTAPPVPADGSLLSPGFQIGVGTALFGVLSASGQLSTYLATSAGLKPHWTVHLPVAHGKLLWNVEPDGSVTVAWEESGSERILRQSFNAEGHPLTPEPEQISSRKPMAWGMPAYGPPSVWLAGSDAEAIVVGESPKSGKRTLQRVPQLKAGTHWDFLRTARGWGLAAIAGDKLYSVSNRNPEWRALMEAPRAESLHVVSLNGGAMWAEWVEPGFGIRRAKLP